MNGRIGVIVAATVTAVGLTGCGGGFIIEPPLNTAPHPGSTIPPYDADAFIFWSDLDGDGCDTRDEVLARDAVVHDDMDGDGCADHDEFVAVLDPYTGHAVSPRGAIDVDHVVARKDAWESGGWAWTDDERETFANDPMNLLAVDDGVNSSKSDDGPGEWRPDTRSRWCVYATTYRDTKLTYQLVITPEEVAALDELLATC